MKAGAAIRAILTLEFGHEMADLTQEQGDDEVRHGEVACHADERVVAEKDDVNAEVCKEEEEGAEHGVGPVQDVVRALLCEQVPQVGTPENGSDDIAASRWLCTHGSVITTARLKLQQAGLPAFLRVLERQDLSLPATLRPSDLCRLPLAVMCRARNSRV